MSNRIRFLRTATLGGVLSIGALGALWWMNPVAEAGAGKLVVYKDPNCGCCSRWIDHLDASGLEAVGRNTRDLPSIKRAEGVPNAMRSCHTAVIDGYFIEGHVPAADIERLLAERPDIRGLAAPGMPVGSPGMEVPGRKPDRYRVYAVARDGSVSVFSEHGGGR